jgi:DNA repair protein RecN (Recombination protein N)
MKLSSVQVREALSEPIDAIVEAVRQSLDALADNDSAALGQTERAQAALQVVTRFDATLEPIVQVLGDAQTQLQDAVHSLRGYLEREVDHSRLASLDARLSAWIGLARRFRRPPAELPQLLAQWKLELRSLEAATDLAALEHAITEAERAYRHEAARLSAARQAAAKTLGQAVTQAMQGLGMAGGAFQVALLPQDAPQSFGLENVEFQVAGHAGSSPRALAKVASGGELSRLALAIAVTTARHLAHGGGAATLIFDEIDAGVGGSVADSVGRLMKQLGARSQVFAVTHLAQVAACGDQHFVVRKHQAGGRAESTLQAALGEARVAEIARMLGGERLSGTAHAQALLQGASVPAPKPAAKRRSRT